MSPPGGGAARPLIPIVEGENFSYRWPQLLPGRNCILFTSGIPGNFEDANLDVFNLGTGQRKTLLRGGYGGRYVSGGYLVYMHQGMLFGIAFDPDRPRNPRRSCASIGRRGVGPGRRNDPNLFFPIRRPGLSQRRGSAEPASRLDGQHRQLIQPLASAPGPYLMPRLSPDGSRIAVWGAPAAPLDLSVYDWQRDRMSRVTFNGQGRGRNPLWSPDGRHLAYGSSRSIGWVRADGAGGDQRLLEVPSLALPFSFTSDGRRLAYSQFSSKTDFDIWTVSLDLTDPDHPKRRASRSCFWARPRQSKVLLLLPGWPMDGLQLQRRW